MKKESQIISRIVAVAREVEMVQQEHEHYMSRPTDNSAESLNERERRHSDYQIKNAQLGGYLDALAWLFEE